MLYNKHLITFEEDRGKICISYIIERRDLLYFFGVISLKNIYFFLYLALLLSYNTIRQ